MLHNLFTNMRSIALASSSEEPTVFEELVDYIVTKYLTPNYAAYEYFNIEIDSDPLVTPAMIFAGAFLAIMAGAAIMIFNRRVLGRLVRRLIKNDALTPDKAKTIEELGLSDSRAIKYFINRLTLAKAVRCVEEDEYYGLKYVPYTPEDYSGDDGKDADRENEKIEARKNDAYAVSINTPRKLRYKRDPKNDHFYIPERKKYQASVRFNVKGTNPLSLLVLGAVYIVLGLIFIRIFPSLLKAIDTAMSALNGY